MSNAVVHFLVSIAITLTVISAALLYLRSITHQVIVDLCQSEIGARFWLRSADIVALAGGLVLVMVFGDFSEGGNWLNSLRATLAASLLSLIITVVWVGVSVNSAMTKRNKVSG